MTQDESNRYSGLAQVPTCASWPPAWLIEIDADSDGHADAWEHPLDQLHPEGRADVDLNQLTAQDEAVLAELGRTP